MGKSSQDEVVDFFIGAGKEDLVYDTTGVKEHEIFESLRNYIERVLNLLLRTENQKIILSLMKNFSKSTKSLFLMRIRVVYKEEARRLRAKMKLKLRREQKEKSSLKT